MKIQKSKLYSYIFIIDKNYGIQIVDVEDILNLRILGSLNFQQEGSFEISLSETEKFILIRNYFNDATLYELVPIKVSYNVCSIINNNCDYLSTLAYEIDTNL